MVADHHTSERVYVRLKADVLERAWDHERLNINTMAQHYDASTTPVREALLRLVGEGLLEMPSSGGFATPRMTSALLRDCYEFSLALVLLVLRHSPPFPGGLPDSFRPSRLNFPIDAVLRELASNTGNEAILLAVVSLNDRMHPIRRMEERRLLGLDSEFDRILAELRRYDLAAVRTLLSAYHRRRQRRIEKILGLVA